MGVIISIEEYRKRRCLEALLADIGLPGFCEECGDSALADLDDLFGVRHESRQQQYPHATILAFPLPDEATVLARSLKKRASARSRTKA